MNNKLGGNSHQESLARSTAQMTPLTAIDTRRWLYCWKQIFTYP